MKNWQTKACMDYMIENFTHKGICIWSWKTTKKSLVVYDYDKHRTVIPLADIFAGVQ